MKQENKDLLKDLCARLPYDIKVQHEDGVFNIDYISSMYGEVHLDIVDNYTIDISEVKPYLFPLSSMTEEQLNDFYATIRPVIEEALDAWKIDKTEYEGERPITLKDIKADIVAVNWMLKNHFDMNGLIPKGLAIDCTNLNIY